MTSQGQICGNSDLTLFVKKELPCTFFHLQPLRFLKSLHFCSAAMQTAFELKSSDYFFIVQDYFVFREAGQKAVLNNIHFIFYA